MSKIIKAVFSSGCFATTAKVFEWDSDDRLQFVNVDLPAHYQVHFANSLSGDSVPVLGDENGAQIPPDMFQPNSEIYAWVYISDNSGGYTKYQAKIPLYARARPTGQTPTPAQQTALDEAITALNEAEQGIPTAIDTALAEAKASGEFDGPAGADGYSPEVTIGTITGGHRVTITDEDHPQGQSFDVMDGQGGGGTSDYTDLSNKPQINGHTLSGNQAASDLGLAPAGAYVKPSGGIPRTDLAFPVRDSLRKADTAYQKPSGGIPATDLASGVIPSVPSASSATPQALGTAAAGTSTDYSRADHVHAKPTYSKSDVGLGNVDNVQQYSATNPPPYPVTSVNGQTGAVTLSIPSTASDVGAVAVSQGVAHAGEFVVVGSDGNITTVTMSVWQGGSF